MSLKEKIALIGENIEGIKIRQCNQFTKLVEKILAK